MSPCSQALGPFEALFARADFAGKVHARSHWQGRELLLLQTGKMQAVISLQGAQLLHFQPAAERPWLWCSTLWPQQGPIRGGIPLCWPWFGAHPQGLALPSHGWARLQEWRLTELQSRDDVVSLGWSLALDDWSAEVQMRLGETLSVELKTVCLRATEVPLSQALHAYWQVSFLDNAQVTTLDGVTYHDKLDGVHKPQRGDVTFSRPLDRVYASGADLLLRDQGWQRTLQIAKRNSDSSVLWHPGRPGLPDAPPVLAAGFVCVEVADGLQNHHVLAVGEQRELGMHVQCSL